jgi:Glycosyl transferases group 1
MAILPRDIVEIGYVGFFKRIMPERTIFLAVECSPDEHVVADYVLQQIDAETLTAQLAERSVRAVILRIHHHPGAAYEQLFRFFVARHAEKWRPFGRNSSLSFKKHLPLALLDFEDESFVHPSVAQLFPIATRIYKRELPVDRWRLLQLTPSTARDEASHRNDAQTERDLGKISPLPLGLPLDERRHFIPTIAATKRSDIFFAGQIAANSWLRRSANYELDQLRKSGVVVDAPLDRLDPITLYRRCSEAWLTWSPQGYGWDCFRHYEASVCRSVPIINYPIIERYNGLRDGEHCIFYDPRPGALTEAVIRSLENKSRLKEMGEAARQHVLKNHTPEATADRILSEIGLSPAPS